MITEKIKLQTAWVMLILMSVGLLIEASFPSTLPENDIPYLDKVLHFLVYGMIAYLTAHVMIKTKRLKIRLIYFSSLTYILILGIAAEYIQSTTSTREPSLADLIADLLGAGAFLFVIHKQRPKKATHY